MYETQSITDSFTGNFLKARIINKYYKLTKETVKSNSPKIRVFVRKCADLTCGNFILNSNLNFNKEVNKRKDSEFCRLRPDNGRSVS